MSRRAYLGPILAMLVLVAAGTAVLTGRLDGNASAATSAAVPSAGCGKAPTLTSGLRTIKSSGKDRQYTMRIPDNYDSSHPYRLVFALHWRGGTMRDLDDPSDKAGKEGKLDGHLHKWAYYGLKHLAENSAIFVTPQGLNGGWANSGGEDLAFIDDMIAQFQSGLCIDKSQQFAAGFSFGGGMSFALACARPTVFRAVAIYSGGQISGCDGGTQPVAYIGIHGIRDNILPIASGRGLRDKFVSNNGCTPQNAPEPERGSLTHIVTYYTGCKPGYPVAWAPFDGGHAPNAADRTANEFEPGENSWTMAVVWDFFTQRVSAPGPTTSPPSPTPSTSPSLPAPSMSPSATVGPPTPSPSTPPGEPSSTCVATYKTVSDWQGGFQGEVTVTNRSAATRSGWTVRLSLGAGQTIGNLWNGVNTGTSGVVTVKNAAYNGNLGPDGSTSFGFVASSSNAAPATATCTSS